MATGMASLYIYPLGDGTARKASAWTVTDGYPDASKHIIEGVQKKSAEKTSLPLSGHCVKVML